MPIPEGAPEPIAEVEAPAVDSGAQLGMEPGDLCQVRIRYKDEHATEEDPAFELDRALPVAFANGEFDAASRDFQWAVAVAAFAEILKGSPYAEPDAIDLIEAVFEANQGSDPDRVELVGLFHDAVALLSGD